MSSATDTTDTTRRDSATNTTATPQSMAAVSVAAAAEALGITATGVRKRLERGQMRGRKVAGQWIVELRADSNLSESPAEPVARDTTTRPMRRDATRRDATEVREIVVLRERLAATERERDTLAADKHWLQQQLEEQTRAASESRVLLLRAQAQLPPAPEAAPRAEEPEKPPAAAEPVQASPAPQRSFWARLFGR